MTPHLAEPPRGSEQEFDSDNRTFRRTVSTHMGPRALTLLLVGLLGTAPRLGDIAAQTNSAPPQVRVNTVALTERVQTSAPPAASPEMKHYDFWPGTWARIVNGEPDPTASTFVVRRGIHPASFEEDWRLVDEAGVVRASRAIRAWDQIGQRWMFVWVSDNALFQVWEGQKVGDRWYIVREFEVDGRRFLSRQAWWPAGRDRVVRVSERSFDGGATWLTRFREEYGRVR